MIYKDILEENSELNRDIRSYINKVEKQNILLKDLKKWNKLCSSLDIIEDTICAILYYVETDYPKKINGKYLFTYGLLQAFYIQQDALCSLNDVLFNNKIKFDLDHPELKDIRDIRNDVVGHPTNRGGKKFIFLTQHSMQKYKFEYSVSGDKELFKKVDVKQLINLQNIEVNKILKKSVGKLKKEFEEFIELYKDVKMVGIFNSINYRREKILTGKDKDIEGFLEVLTNMINDCKDELNKRYTSWGETGSFSYIIKELEEMINLILGIIFEQLDNKFLNLTEYLTEHLFCKIDFLIQCCKDVDEYFENYGELKINNSKINKTIIIDDIPNDI